MSEFFPLDIFPQGALRESVITTVWVGIFVFSLLNLRFGWTYSGLVVPGYLLPLLMLKPITACVIICEAVISYYLVVLISRLPEKLGLWCRFFGRDRFFAVLLTSVIVRMLFDGWLLPELGGYLQAHYFPSFNYRGDFFSFGTLVVALLANALWKPGARWGLMTLSVITGISYLIVRFLLIPFTNFNISGLEFMYEDFATSFLASPKVYIILLTVAFLASYLNRRYGWEYNGIIIPALLGLIWHQPLKVVFSFAEAALILVIAHGIIRLPFIRDLTMEGARKLLLFFNISFVMKILLGHALLYYAPYEQITDFYGFGYLLPTLIAVKVFDKSIPLRLTTATIQVAFGGAVLASIIGFLLTFLPALDELKRPQESTSSSALATISDLTLTMHLADQKISMYHALQQGVYAVPLSREATQFRRAMEGLSRFQKSGYRSDMDSATRRLVEIGFNVVMLENRYLCIYESAPYRGWGLYVFDIEQRNGPVIEVPAPLDEWSTMETGLALFKRFNGSAMAIAGAQLKTNPDQSSNVLLRHQSFFHIFHTRFNQGNVLQVRGYSSTALRKMFKLPERAVDTPGAITRKSTIWVKKRMPTGVQLGIFDNMQIPLEVMWRPAPIRNIQVEESHGGIAELWLNRPDRRRLLATTLYDSTVVTPTSNIKRIDGFLLDNILKHKTAIARAGTDLYKAPGIQSQLFFDQEILTPLFQISSRAYDKGVFTDTAREELAIIYNVCERMGYESIWYRHKPTSQDYLILKQREDAPDRRYWGTYVIRLGDAAPYLVQIPRPLYDKNSFEFGVRLFERLNARAVAISGAHRFTNQDGSADLLNPDLKGNLLNLFTQSWLRAKGDEAGMVIQCRALSKQYILADEVDILATFDDGSRSEADLSPLGRTMVDHLVGNGMRLRLVNGDYETAGYEIVGSITAGYLRQAQAKEFSVLWVGGSIRSALRQQTAESLLSQVIQSAGIPLQEDELASVVKRHLEKKGPGRLSETLRNRLEIFAKEHDIMALAEFRSQFSRNELTYVIDRNTRLSFMLVFDTDSKLAGVLNLSSGRIPKAFSTDAVEGDIIEQFIDSGCLWLVPRGGGL